MRRILVLLTTMVAGVLLACGVAWAANITCQGGLCVGTPQNDRITGSLLDDHIRALGGRDLVMARSGDDEVEGLRGHDNIFGGVGGDLLFGGEGPDDLDGGPGTTDASEPPFPFTCSIEADGIDARTEGTQVLLGEDGNDILTGGRDNDDLNGEAGTNDLSGEGGSDCLVVLFGDENDRASGGAGDDIIFADESIFGADTNADNIFCGAGIDTVSADAEDRVAAGCENVVLGTPVLQTPGSTPQAEVSITTPEGTITTTP